MSTFTCRNPPSMASDILLTGKTFFTELYGWCWWQSLYLSFHTSSLMPQCIYKTVQNIHILFNLSSIVLEIGKRSPASAALTGSNWMSLSFLPSLCAQSLHLTAWQQDLSWTCRTCFVNVEVTFFIQSLIWHTIFLYTGFNMMTK